MNKKGFTLIELLVVISIIGVLSTLAVVSLNNARQKARDAKRVSDIKQVQTALELYFVDEQSYPVQGSNTAMILIGSDLYDCLDSNGFSAACSADDTTYMGQVPTNPTPGASAYGYHSTNADGTDCTSGTCISYEIDFELEGQTGALESGAHIARPSGIGQ